MEPINDLERLDEYSSTPGNQSDMLQFLGVGFRTKISSIPIAKNLFADIFGRLTDNDLLTQDPSDTLTLVFLGSGYAALELFVALKILDFQQNAYGVSYRSVHIILCDYLYGRDQILVDKIGKIITASNVKVIFVPDLQLVPGVIEKAKKNVSRKNTFFFAFNFNLAIPKNSEDFLKELDNYPILASCRIYAATSIGDTKKKHNEKGLFVEFPQLKEFFETYNTKSSQRRFLEAKCGWCNRNNMQLQHCGGCLDVLYCNTKCQARDWERAHQYTCEPH